MITEFQKKVYVLCKRIPKGKVSTYGEIAKALGGKGMMSRAVGNALNKNPFGAWGRVGGPSCRRQDLIVPCHRVVKSDGSIGGFATGSKKKIRILAKEGIQIRNNRIIDFKNRLFRL
jgi:methylated-DNA-[protein]-cysteine S-methyltransferase